MRFYGFRVAVRFMGFNHTHTHLLQSLTYMLINEKQREEKEGERETERYAS